MQSWGTQSRFTVRDTGTEPSKSGVLGLVCAALGRPRSEPVDDLAALRIGVRVDQPGVLRADFHTAGGTYRKDTGFGVAQASGKGVTTVLSTRYYLSDADFLVGLEGEDALLRQVDAALQAPVWQLSLGRKAFVPGVPVWVPDGWHADQPLEEVLTRYPWPRPDLPLPPAHQRPHRLRLVLEVSPEAATGIRRDQPVGAAFATRTFALRSIATAFVEPLPLREDADVPVSAGA